MIQELHIKNYESHKDTHLRFPPGLTVFIGDSDRGKSGTFRAFNWVRSNQPRGEGMRPLFWEGETSVTVVLDSHETITRKKGKSINEYTAELITTPEMDFEEISHNAGTAPPDFVPETLRMGETCYQSQVDRAFLMFDTPGERGRILNKISGLEAIDQSIYRAQKDIKNQRQKMKNAENKILQYKTDLDPYNTLPDLEKVIQIANELTFQITTETTKTTSVKRAYNLKEDALEQLAQIPDLDTARNKLQKATEIRRQYLNMTTLTDNVRDLSERAKELEGKKKDGDKLAHVRDLLEKADDLYVDRANEGFRLSNLKKRILVAVRNRLAIDEIQKSIDEIKKQIPKICPECGGPVK